LTNNDLLEICSGLLDRLTVIKGFLNLNIERTNVDYSLMVLKEIEALELIINDLVDRIRDTP
jgi:hypothetical protein